MNTQTENTTKIKKFFFGEMAEDERFEFEQAFASNPELLEKIRAVEADLIEEYIRGWMNPAEKSIFEQNFLNTQKRRNKVEFSRQLISELSRERSIQSTTDEKESLWNRLVRSFLIPKIAMGTACAVLLLIFSMWFLNRNSEIEKVEIVKNENTTINEIPNQNTAPNFETPAVNLNQNPATNIEANQTNKTEPSPGKTPEKKKLPTPESPKPVQNPVLALSAGTLRSDGDINELVLPENSRGATFRLSLKTVDYKQFQAGITDGNGKVIFRSSVLTPQKTAVNLFVPAKNLQKGDYRINLLGKNAAGEYESVADFQFRVL